MSKSRCGDDHSQVASITHGLPAGVRVFAKVYPAGLDPAAWTLEEQLRVLKHTELRRYLGWAWKNKVVPQWPMSNADLRGASLTGADLCEADLTEEDLSMANLTEEDLSVANLTEAGLTEANLTEANLTKALWDAREPPAGWRVNQEGRLERC